MSKVTILKDKIQSRIDKSARDLLAIEEDDQMSGQDKLAAFKEVIDNYEYFDKGLKLLNATTQQNLENG